MGAHCPRCSKKCCQVHQNIGQRVCAALRIYLVFFLLLCYNSTAHNWHLLKDRDGDSDFLLTRSSRESNIGRYQVHQKFVGSLVSGRLHIFNRVPDVSGIPCASIKENAFYTKYGASLCIEKLRMEI
jgi:hypothetical protein